MRLVPFSSYYSDIKSPLYRTRTCYENVIKSPRHRKFGLQLVALLWPLRRGSPCHHRHQIHQHTLLPSVRGNQLLSRMKVQHLVLKLGKIHPLPAHAPAHVNTGNTDISYNRDFNHFKSHGSFANPRITIFQMKISDIQLLL